MHLVKSEQNVRVLSRRGPYAEDLWQDVFRLAGAVQETYSSELFGGQGADFLRGVVFWSIRSSGLLRWFCMTSAALRMTWPHFIVAGAILLWEFGGHRLWLTRSFFSKKSSLWLSPNLSSKSLSVCLALFLYHVDHPNKHHQQIRLTKQVSKSSLVLIWLFWIFTGIYQRPNRLPMLETSATVTGQPWCALILPPSQPPQSRNAISQWRPRLCQWRPRLRSRKKWK